MRTLFTIGLCVLFTGCANWNDGCPGSRSAFGMCSSSGGYYGNYDGWIRNRAAHHGRIIESKNK
jgi:hypothetical protein